MSVGAQQADGLSQAEPEVSALRASIPSAWPLQGYAPGGYSGRCHDCGEVRDDMDKRAWRCLECAVRDAKRVIEQLADSEVALTHKNDTYRSLLVYFASDTHDVKPDAIRTLAKNALASAIEARSGETTQIGSTEGESAAPAGETPK